MSEPNTETERTCDYPGCNDSTNYRDGRGSRYCAMDHLSAARNGIAPSDLDEYDVEYGGISGTFREESNEAAQRQWKHQILSRRLNLP